MNRNPLKVIYIAGWGRSGSTLLARILGQVDGVAHMGELRTIWTDGFKSKSVCGCGTPTHDCDVWQAIMNQAFGGIEQVDLPAMVQLRRQSEPKTSELLKFLVSSNKAKRFLHNSESYRHVLEKLYGSIQNVCGVEAIVDDSLHPGYAYALASVPSLEVFLVHLIRDARGCTYSWEKRCKNGLGSYTLKDSALGWDLRNIATETLRSHPKFKYHQLRYEDFVNHPQESAKAILEFAEMPTNSLTFSSPSTVALEATHSIFGNDNRAETGTISLRLDEVWKKKMPLVDQLKVCCMTWPLLLKYQYMP